MKHKKNPPTIAADGSKSIGVHCCDRSFETADEAERHEQEHRQKTCSPGAIRAGQRIHEILKRHLLSLSDSNAETLAAIIDAETGAKELFDALTEIVKMSPFVPSATGLVVSLTFDQITQAQVALAKVEGRT